MARRKFLLRVFYNRRIPSVSCRPPNNSSHLYIASLCQTKILMNTSLRKLTSLCSNSMVRTIWTPCWVLNQQSPSLSLHRYHQCSALALTQRKVQVSADSPSPINLKASEMSRIGRPRRFRTVAASFPSQKSKGAIKSSLTASQSIRQNITKPCSQSRASIVFPIHQASSPINSVEDVSLHQSISSCSWNGFLTHLFHSTFKKRTASVAI